MALGKPFFRKVAKTIFKVFTGLQYKVTYVAVVEDGFSELPVETPVLVDMIIDSFAERDTQFLSFSNLLQPTDVKGLVRGEQLAGVELSTNDLVRMAQAPDIDENTVEYHVIAYNTDPAQALYTLLLRKV